jgi:hypothetical protein
MSTRKRSYTLNVCTQTTQTCTPYILYCNLVSVLNAAADYFVPQHKKDFFKFWWDEALQLIKEESIESNLLWKNAAKPRHGPIFDKRQACRLRYRKRIKDGQKRQLSSYTNDLHEQLCTKNGPAFWKIWRSKFENINVCDQVDGSVDNTTIANKFVQQFSAAYACNSTGRAAELQSEYTKLRNEYFGLPLTDEYLFDTELVCAILAKLKRGKAGGLDNLSAEHLIYSHPSLPCVLYKMFNLILLCRHVPPDFGQSYTVPIPKLSDCRTKAMTTDDFRGIAISPIISKIFEHCILDRFDSFFYYC